MQLNKEEAATFHAALRHWKDYLIQCVPDEKKLEDSIFKTIDPLGHEEIADLQSRLRQYCEGK